MISQNTSPAALGKTAIFFAAICCAAAAVGVATPLLAATPRPELAAKDLPASAQPIGSAEQEPSSNLAETPASAPQSTLDPVAQAQADADATFGSRTLKPGEFVWSNTADLARGQPRVVVSIADQRAYLYRGNTLVALTTASTGRQGHPTPTGTFTVTERRKVHFSNKYNSAPMPYMQRLTGYGIALHAGAIPGYPASHGCIRLPHKFAADLFKVTDIGTTVVIAA